MRYPTPGSGLLGSNRRRSGGAWFSQTDPKLAFLLSLACALSLLVFAQTGAGQMRTDAEGEISDSLAFEILRHLAREDTVEIDYFFGRWVESVDQRPTLKEIIGWCIENERTKHSKVHDLQYRRRLRALMSFGEKGDTTARRIVDETVHQIYIEPPDRYLERDLGTRRWDSKENETEVEVTAGVRTSGSSLADLPVFFEQLDDYRFEILERRLLHDRVLYKIGFEPRSEFAALPVGWFLVDTMDYQILRAEYRWTENVPFPIFLKAVDRIAIQRRKFGQVWLPAHVVGEITLRKLPLVTMPCTVEFLGEIEDVRLDEGIPDSVWVH